MKLSKEIKQKIMQLKQVRERSNKLEQEIFKYLENKGIDINDNEFIDDVGAKLSYGEFDTIEEFENYLNDFLDSKNS